VALQLRSLLDLLSQLLVKLQRLAVFLGDEAVRREPSAQTVQDDGLDGVIGDRDGRQIGLFDRSDGGRRRDGGLQSLRNDAGLANGFQCR
jgi:hypothetical protein